MRKLQLSILVGFVCIGVAVISVLYFRTPRRAMIVASLSLRTLIAKNQERGLRLALEDAGARAGGIGVDLLVLDDSGTSKVWSAALESANAERAVSQPDVVAYYGPVNSGAVKVSLPITNRAGLLQISGAATWPGLTAAGFQEGEPAKFYPSGERTFFRFTPSDAVTAPAAVSFLESMGIQRIALVDDGGVFGVGVTNLVAARARMVGLSVVYQGNFTPDSVPTTTLDAIVSARPEAVFIGANDEPALAQLYIRLRARKYDGDFVGEELSETGLSSVIAPEDDRVYSTSPGLPQLNARDASMVQLFARYQNKYQEQPTPYTVYAYEAMRMLLAAIARAGVDRAGVLSSFRSTKDFMTSFGEVNFDLNGDIKGGETDVFHFIRGDWVVDRVIPSQ